MIVIGEQLREAREQKNLDLEQVSSDTNIARRYLTALEEDNFSVFPGDPYIVGFLRNYADYLGLDSSGLIAAFKNMRIQEQPMPLEALIPARRKPVLPIVGAVAALAAVGFGLFYFLSPKSSGAPAAAASQPDKPAEYGLDSSPFERRFYPGDVIVVSYASEKWRLAISGIGDRLSIDTPVGRSLYMLGEEGAIDLDKDNVPEILVYVGDFDKNDGSKGALIRFTKSGRLAEESGAPAAQATGDKGAAEPAAGAPGTTPTAAGTAPAGATPAALQPETPVNTAKGIVLFADNKSPYPFVLSTTFRNYCMFRYEVDRRDRDERYYQKGDQLTVNANNGMKLWVSNAAAVKASVQASGGRSTDIEFGQPGAVAVKQIKWVQAENGTWSLVLYDVD